MNDDEAIAPTIEPRLGGLRARQRVGIELEHETQMFRQGPNFFQIYGEIPIQCNSVTRTLCPSHGALWRGRRNAGSEENLDELQRRSPPRTR